MRSALVASCLVILGSSTVPAQRPDLLQQLGVADVATMERMVMVPMRDGIRLSTAVLRPRIGDRLPTVLIRTPYLKDGEVRDHSLFGRLIREGYAVVIQNERGTEWSEGTHRFLAGARTDGYDALTWIAAQPWSNGRVGTIGCSSSAEDQLGLAAMNHPAHRAMIPMSAGAGIGSIPGVTSQGLFYKGGVPQLGPWAGWYVGSGHANRPKLPAAVSEDERTRLADYYSPFVTAESRHYDNNYLPSRDVLRAAGVPETDFDTFMTMSPADVRWLAIDFIRDGDRPRVPGLHVNGWHDVGAFETVKLFEYLKDVPDQYLIMAPTAHCAMTSATAGYRVGERPVGNAKLPYEDLFVQWFDHWLKDRPNDVQARPRVQAFLEGADTWKTYPALPATTPVKFFLRSDGRAQGMKGTGRLALGAPGEEPADSVVSDPIHPVPSRGGGCCDRDAVRDQRPVEARTDVLVYSTEPLREGMAVLGEVKVKLFLSSSALDTDVAIKLIDVYPDGRAFNLYDAMQRLRYRDGYDTAKTLEPGKVYPVDVTGLVAGNYFAPGHRIRIEVAGSNFPNFERNLQTGGRNYDETQGVVAVNRVHHAPGRASYIELPTIPR